MVFKSFRFCLTLCFHENLRKSDFQGPIISQILTINNLTSTKAKSIKPKTIGNLIEYTLKKYGTKVFFTPPVFEVLMSEGRSVLSTSQKGAGNEMVQVSRKK